MLEWSQNNLNPVCFGNEFCYMDVYIINHYSSKNFVNKKWLRLHLI